MRDIVDLVVDLRSASREHQWVRLAILLGVAVYAVALAIAGTPGVGTFVLLGVIGVLVLFQPHAIAPTLFLGFAVVAWWWTVEVEPAWHWALLPAALGVLLVHTASALAAAVPPQADIPHAVLRRWAARLGLVSALTVVLWGVTGVLAHRSTEAFGALPGIVGLVVLVLGLVAYLRWRTPREA